MLKFKDAIKTTIFLVICLFNLTATYSQTEGETEELWRIETVDGNVYVGKVQKSDGDVVVLETTNIGVINIPRADIVLMTKGDSDITYRNRKLEASSYSHSRYFFTPNGYTMKKGEGYYHNFMVFINQATYGVTDNISIGGGLVPLFLFAGPTPVWVTPKVSFPVIENKFNMGAGAFLGGVIGEDAGLFGIAYGVATYGTRENNVNLGVGFGFFDGDWADTPVFGLSGMFEVSRRTTLMFESFLITDVFLMAAGGRTNLGKISLDYGLVKIPEDGGIPFFPILGFVIPFY